MDIVRIEDIAALSRWREGPCISVFMPAHRAGVDTLQGPIRLKNHLREAEQQLAQAGWNGHSALLAPFRKLVDDFEFWQHQAGGLALYAAPSFQRTFRLPVTLQDLVVVTGRFHVKPVLQMLTEEDRFYTLGLSQKHLRLLRCTRFTQEELALPAEALAALANVSADLPEIQVQARSAGGAQGNAIFHGNPAGLEENKMRLLTRFQRLDRSLRDAIGPDDAPLVLACVEYLFPIYREASDHPRLSPEAVLGNPETLRNDELRARAWKVVEPIVTARRARAIAAFREAIPGGRASGDVAAVVPAAADGRVESLLVAVGKQQWGVYDPVRREVQVHPAAQPGDEDLLDLAAVLTLEKSGSVFAVPPEKMPDGLPLAAVYRY